MLQPFALLLLSASPQAHDSARKRKMFVVVYNIVFFLGENSREFAFPGEPRPRTGRAPHCARLLKHIRVCVCRGRAAHLRSRRGRARAFCVVFLADGLMAKHHLTYARRRRRTRARCPDARSRRRACMPVPGERMRVPGGSAAHEAAVRRIAPAKRAMRSGVAAGPG